MAAAACHAHLLPRCCNARNRVRRWNSGSPSRGHKSQGGAPRHAGWRLRREADLCVHCTICPVAPRSRQAASVHRYPRTFLDLPEGFPWCVIPRWLRGQPGQSDRHPAPFLLAFLAPDPRPRRSSFPLALALAISGYHPSYSQPTDHPTLRVAGELPSPHCACGCFSQQVRPADTPRTGDGDIGFPVRRFLRSSRCRTTGSPNATCEKRGRWARQQNGATNLEALRLQFSSPLGMCHLPLCSLQRAAAWQPMVALLLGAIAIEAP